MMNTKIVYVLVSDATDFYLEQVLISLYSLKKHSPSAYSCLVVDAHTDESLVGKRREVLNYADEKVVVKVPEEYGRAESSRYMKTNLRQYLKGPYLFVDTDTVIASDLEEIDQLIDEDVDIAAVSDDHCLFKEMKLYNQIVSRMQSIGWDDLADEQIHFNSGVMFVSDNERTHEFYKKWYENWLTERERGLYYDQIALARTIKDMNYPIREMDGIWNCQIFYGALRFLSTSKIIHYSTDYRTKYSYTFRNKEIFEAVKREGSLPDQYLCYVDRPREAFVGHSMVCGDAEMGFYYSIFRNIALDEPREFERIAKWVGRYMRYRDKWHRGLHRIISFFRHLRHLK